MAVYKDNATGTWRVIYRFTNWKGERKQTQKRGFATKREAQAWEHEVMLKQNSKLDMTFASFFELYEADKKQRVKDNGFEWIGEYDISADELLNGDGKGQKSRKAKEFLLEILADGGMSQKKILEEAAKRGIKGKTLRNAKSELEVDSVKRGNQWYWVLPE